MTDMQTLFKTVDALSIEQRQQLLRYLEQQLNETIAETPSKKRILGLHAQLGAAWISDDFTDELPDEFWGFD